MAKVWGWMNRENREQRGVKWAQIPQLLVPFPSPPPRCAAAADLQCASSARVKTQFLLSTEEIIAAGSVPRHNIIPKHVVPQLSSSGAKINWFPLERKCGYWTLTTHTHTHTHTQWPGPSVGSVPTHWRPLTTRDRVRGPRADTGHVTY